MSMVAKLLGALVICLVWSSASATPILDQNQPAVYSIPLAGFDQPGLAQSFQQTHGNIDGAGIHLNGGHGTTDTVTIALWNALPNQPGANLLASGSGTATAGSWLDVFWSPATVTPGTTYYLVFTSPDTNVATTLLIDGPVNNPYPNGEAFANAGYQAYPNDDYTFRTYYDNAVNSVPEPASLGLFGIGSAGILALVLLRRRRQLVS